jgi:hypothetical protein
MNDNLEIIRAIFAPKKKKKEREEADTIFYLIRKIVTLFSIWLKISTFPEKKNTIRSG